MIHHVTARSADGEEVTIVRIEEGPIQTGALSEEVNQPKGLRRLETTDGEHVNRIAKGVYEIDGVRFTSEDQHAP